MPGRLLSSMPSSIVVIDPDTWNPPITHVAPTRCQRSIRSHARGNCAVCTATKPTTSFVPGLGEAHEQPLEALRVPLDAVLEQVDLERHVGRLGSLPLRVAR